MKPSHTKEIINFHTKENQLLLEGKKFLLAEDNSDQQIIYQHMLIKLKAKVEIVDCGLKAVDKVQATPSNYDAIILDYFMPGMNGIETAKAIRQKGYLAPIIGMTAQYDEVNKYEWFMAGCDVIMKKPILTEQFIKHISYCFAIDVLKS